MIKHIIIIKNSTILLIIGTNLWIFFCCEKKDPCQKKFLRLVYALKFNTDIFPGLSCHLIIWEKYRFVLGLYCMGCRIFFDKASKSKKCQNGCFSEKFWPKSGQLKELFSFFCIICTIFILINLCLMWINRNYWNYMYFKNWPWNRNWTLTVLLVIFGLVDSKMCSHVFLKLSNSD